MRFRLRVGRCRDVCWRTLVGKKTGGPTCVAWWGRMHREACEEEERARGGREAMRAAS